MTTATAPWAEFDEKFRLQHRHETQRYELALWSQPGQSDSTYRDYLAQAAKAAEELAGLRDHLANLQAQSDVAVARHAEITGPLQEQLAGNLPVQKRIAIRAEVNKANSDLEAALAELKPLIAACEAEIEYLRPRAGIKAQIEMAAMSSGSLADQDRLRILKTAMGELENFLIDKWQRKSAAADELAAKKSIDQDRHEQSARVFAGVLEAFQKARNVLQAEANQIYQRRLRELYAAE